MEIPGYQIEHELGRGGFAVVYLARQPALHRTVAVKVLTQIDPNDAESLGRFEAECQAIGSLSWHPHVVTVHDVGQTRDGRPFLAMEHLPHGSLQTKLAEHGSAPWTEVVRVGIQIADALAAAHQAGILHRDLKPANVLTDRLGEYRLADFGIARFGEVNRTATGVITGTIAYTAPEVLTGAKASVASDLYGLGAMMHALVTGQAPFVEDADESLVTIMYRATTQAAPSLIPYGVPELLAQLVAGLMAKDPASRPPSAVEVGQWFQKIQQENGIPVTPLRSAPHVEPAAPAGARMAAAQTAVVPPGSPPIPPAPPTPSPPPPVYVPAASPIGPPTPAPTPPPSVYAPSYPAPPGPSGLDRRLLWIVAAVVLVVAFAVAVAILALGGGDEQGGSTTTSASTTSSPSTPSSAGTAAYPQVVRQNFLNGCGDAGGSERFCGCVIDALEAEVPFADFDGQDRPNDLDDGPTGEVRDVFERCADETGG